MCDAAPIVKAARKSVTLFKPLEMRTSADRDESYPRIRQRISYRDEGICARARARLGIYACGSGREVPSFGWFFVSCITRAHVHTHTRTPTSASVSEKNVHAGTDAGADVDADAGVRAFILRR